MLDVLCTKFKLNIRHPHRRIIRKSKEKYCLNRKKSLCGKCLKWHRTHFRNHALINLAVNLSCIFHDGKHYNYSCDHGNKHNFCFKCKQKMLIHPLTKIEPIDIHYYKKNYYKFKKIMMKNKILIEKMIERIQNENSESTHKKKKIISVLSAYKLNTILNKALLKLTKCLTVTGFAFRHHMTHQLSSLYSFKINNKKITLSNDINSDYLRLVCHFLRNLLLIQITGNERIKTMKGHQDFVWCLISLLDGNTIASSTILLKYGI